jgi:hypothetical protein
MVNTPEGGTAYFHNRKTALRVDVVPGQKDGRKLKVLDLHAHYLDMCQCSDNLDYFAEDVERCVDQLRRNDSQSWKREMWAHRIHVQARALYRCSQLAGVCPAFLGDGLCRTSPSADSASTACPITD